MHKNDWRRTSNVFTFDQKKCHQNLMAEGFCFFDCLLDGQQSKTDDRKLF
jgi:hypothetical protein